MSKVDEYFLCADDIAHAPTVGGLTNRMIAKVIIYCARAICEAIYEANKL